MKGPVLPCCRSGDGCIGSWKTQYAAASRVPTPTMKVPTNTTCKQKATIRNRKQRSGSNHQKLVPNRMKLVPNRMELEDTVRIPSADDEGVHEHDLECRVYGLRLGVEGLGFRV